MNYYIQGNKEKADKIKAAFEKLGYDVTGFDMRNDNILFFTYKLQAGANVISTTNANLYTAEIIKTHPDYKELELPVEPKFKVGDWIARDSDSFTLSIKSVRDENYYFHQGGSLLIKDVDKYYHLWTIADAQDGDILHHSCTASNGTFIFKDVNESGKIFCYCDYDSEDYFCLGEYHHIPYSPESKFLHPATKEQRDLLFKKMREAGYEWDENKKELKKIQPHYDIANFYAGMPVLVREYDTCHWQWVQYSHFNGVGLFFAAGKTWRQCIPYNDDTKHLVGTTNPCDEQYINW